MAGNLTAMIASIFSGGVSTDPYFNLTTLLLSTTATNGQQNNTFQDSSTNNFTITRNPATGPNAPTQGTFSPFSQTGWSNYFSSANISCPNINFSTNAFCIEGWFYFTDVTTQNINLWGTTSGSGSQPKMNLVANYQYNSNLLNFDVGSFGTNPLSASMSYINNNAWNHIAIVREGTGTNQAKMYINGTARSTGTFSGNCSTITGVFNICYMGEVLGIKFPGWVSNFRIVNGSPVYTADFTPSTTPLTAITNTVLLTCQANRFVDSNTQVAAKTITLTGTPTVVPFSPFNPTSAWSASTVGGSGYFDGTGDYLSTPSSSAFSFGTGDFTIEYWVYVNSGTNNGIFQLSDTAGGLKPSQANSLAMNIFTNNAVSIYANGTSYQAPNNTLPYNSWTHFAIVRSSNVTKLYANGSLVTSIGSSGSITDNTNYTGLYVAVGGYYSTSYLMTGYVSNFRIVKGTAVYTSNFTPPTAPLTAITNTSLLLNFTNSGIYDATAKNVLETVGNAQVSTTQSKWSPTSMYFDGTGDYLAVPDNPYQRIGTGNFTVECWVYRNSSGTYGLIGKGTGTTGWLLSLNSSNQVVFTYGSSTITSTGTVSATTWTHIAVVREGTSTNQTKIYISGTNDGTGTVSTDFTQTNVMYVAADRTAGSNANAYVQDARVTRYARYTANFSVPTAAFPVQ